MPKEGEIFKGRRPSKMGIQHRDTSGTTWPGHMERFEQREKKKTQKKD